MNMFDSRSLMYKQPFGAVKTNEIVKLWVRICARFYVQKLVLVLCEVDKWNQTTEYKMEWLRSESDYNLFYVQFCIPKPQVYFYYFKLTVNNVTKNIKRKYNNESGFEDEQYKWLWQLTVSDIVTPDFLKGGIMYQIFPDRFNNSHTLKSNVPKGRKIRDDWGNLPEYLPNEEGKILNNDYFGGDIKGIIQKLDYIQKLGVNAIYLNPIVEAHSNHRYDTANYLAIDPLLGSLEDFKNLCTSAHRLGIKIILDGVFNHTGSDSVYFNKNNRYDTVGAYNSKASKYYSWYSFSNYPDAYDCWWGINTLPKLNNQNNQVINYLFGKDGVLDKWMDFADGVRLDVADELSDKELDAIRTIVKSHGDKIVIGEVWEDASNKVAYGKRRRYLLGQQLDSVMNYPFKEAILAYIRYGDCQNFKNTVMSILENYPKQVLDTLMNFLSTHDTQRAITKLVAEECDGKNRQWQAQHHNLSHDQYLLGKKRLKLATLLQFFMPGVPCIYYGDEVGMYGYKDPFNRCCYPWDSQDTQLLDFFVTIAKIRTQNYALMLADFEIVRLDSSVCITERYTEKEKLIVAINRSENYQNIDSFKDCKKDVIFTLENSNISGLNAYGAIIFKIST